MVTDLEIIQFFFHSLDEIIQSSIPDNNNNAPIESVSATASTPAMDGNAAVRRNKPAQLAVTTLLFEIDNLRFCATIGSAEAFTAPGQELSPGVLNLGEANGLTVKPNCTLSCNMKVMCCICLGKAKPMSLILNGSLKIRGDRKSIFPFTSYLKLAGQATAANINTRSSTQSGSILDVHILGTIEVPENDVVDKTIVKYFVEVKDLSASFSWNVSRRYSEFLRLRQELLLEYTNRQRESNGSFSASSSPPGAIDHKGKPVLFPPLPSRSSGLFSSKQQLIKYRMVVLTNFIQAVVFIFAQENASLNKFLGYDRKASLLHTLTTRSSLTASNLQVNGNAKESGATAYFASVNRMKLGISDDTDTASTAFHDLKQHASTPIHCDTNGGSRLDVLYQELIKPKESPLTTSTAMKFEGNLKNSDNGGPLMRFIRTVAIVTVAISSLNLAIQMVSTAVRFCSSQNCQLNQVSPSFCYISDRSSNETLKQSELGLPQRIISCWQEMSHTFNENQEAFAIQKSILFGFTLFLLVALSTRTLKRVYWANTIAGVILSSCYYSFTIQLWDLAFSDHELIARESKYQFDYALGVTWNIVRLVSSSFLGVIWTVAVALVKSVITLSVGAAGWWNGILLWALIGCAISIHFNTSFWSKVLRLGRIYSLGVLLMGIYVPLKLVCWVFRLPTRTQESLYRKLDLLMVPFITYQMGQLRSIFVKMAQYVGGRADFLSELWTENMSKLHDCCPPSSQEYIRQEIEKKFGPMEEVFMSFDLVPMASASIAQVHAAVMKEGVIDRLVEKYLEQQQQQQQEGQGREMKDSVRFATSFDENTFLETMFPNPEGSAIATSSDDNIGAAAGSDFDQYVVVDGGSTLAADPHSQNNAPQPNNNRRSTGGGGGSLIKSNSNNEFIANVLGSSAVTASTPSTPSKSLSVHFREGSNASNASDVVGGGGPNLMSSPTLTPSSANGKTRGTLLHENATTTRDSLQSSRTNSEGNSNAATINTNPAMDFYANQVESSGPLHVVVKVQHERVADIMKSDMAAASVLVNLAARLDNRWQLLVDLLKTWARTMDDELDFRKEAENLIETGRNMKESEIGVLVPKPIFGLVSESVMVMTKLNGHKVTDRLQLSLYAVDKEALLNRIAHSSAYQLLVSGTFNADPHAGNLLFCPMCAGPRSDTNGFSQESGSKRLSRQEECLPGLLDFGMTVRLSEATRISYCQLILSLYEGDLDAAIDHLAKLGYVNSQTARAPERDVEFFSFLLRDAKPRNISLKESTDFSTLRNIQKDEDVRNGVREKGGRTMSEIPSDFVFLARVIGLLRGLTAELGVECPILHILALNAKYGLLKSLKR